MNVNLVVNPIAGHRAFRSIQKIEDLLKRKVSLTTLTTRKKGDAYVFARELSASGLIIVAGGDGTFNEVINGLLSDGSLLAEKRIIPLAFVPLGTSNVLAKELNIPEDIEQAVNFALTGTPRKISLGRINGRYFSLMAGIGFDGETVLRVKDSIKKIHGKGAYILSGIKTLIGYCPPLITVKTPEGTFAGYTAVIGNARCYGGNFHLTHKADITEPMLDLCLIKNNGRTDLIKFAGAVVLNKHPYSKDIIYGKFSSIEISSDKTVHIQIDGDYFGTLPAKIDVVKDAVSVIS